VNRTTVKLAGPLAAALASDHPDLISEKDVGLIARQIAEFCDRLVLGRDNDRRIAICNALMAKRDRGEAWDDKEEEQADFYGVSGPRRMVTLPNGQEVPARFVIGSSS
jgi:hypothetical protein